MSKKRCVRKVWALTNPIAFAIEGARTTPRAILDELLLRELSGLEAFAKGQSGLQEWCDMAAINNLTETLAGMHIGAEALPDCKTAEKALIEAAERFERTGIMGLSGVGLQAVRAVIEWHDLQRSSVARSVYERAIKLTADIPRVAYNESELRADLPNGSRIRLYGADNPDRVVPPENCPKPDKGAKQAKVAA